MIFSFSSFCTATLKLLNCEMVGSISVLFYAGAKQCGVWQLPVYLLLVLLMCVPLLPVLVQLLCLLPPSWRVTAWARTKHWPRHSVMQAIRKHAAEPFEQKQQHWAAVLMLQRLLTVACHALAPSELLSELGVAIVSVWLIPAATSSGATLPHPLGQPLAAAVGLVPGDARDPERLQQ
jgi:hypothetical protein